MSVSREKTERCRQSARSTLPWWVSCETREATLSIDTKHSTVWANQPTWAPKQTRSQTSHFTVHVPNFVFMSQLSIKTQSDCHQRQLILFPYLFVVILSLSTWFSDQNWRHGGQHCRDCILCVHFLHCLLLQPSERLVVLQITNTVPSCSTHRELSNGISHDYIGFPYMELSACATGQVRTEGEKTLRTAHGSKTLRRVASYSFVVFEQFSGLFS